VRCWAEEVVQKRNDVLRVGYFGSYARGDWGVGSDLDLVIVIKSSAQPFEKRAAQWDTTKLPVPTELLVYTEEEWRRLDRQSRFYQTLLRETVWVYLRKNA
jgi:predicted nucleotidyltransferase